MRSWTITVEGEIFPTSNVFLRMPRLRAGRRRSSTTVYQNDLVHTWAMLLLEAGLQEVPGARRRRRVSIERHGPGDPDQTNLYTCADKLILDNLVRSGALVDDNMKWLELGPIRPIRSKEKKTVILIEEIT